MQFKWNKFDPIETNTVYRMRITQCELIINKEKPR